MTRFFYFILPLVAMVAFGGYYYGVFYRDQVAHEQAEKQRLDEEARIAREAKVAAEAKSAAEAKARAEQKREDEQKKRDERERKQKEADDKLAEDTEAAEKRATALGKTHADLEIQLAELRRSREAEQKKAFELRRQVEEVKIERRNAELAIQLDTEKIASRVDGSSMVQMPIFPKQPPTEAPATNPR